jgi:hypothetical protein
MTVFIDIGGCLDQVELDVARSLLARVRSQWTVQVWSACLCGIALLWDATHKDFSLVQPGDVVVDDDPVLLRLARRRGARGIPARDLYRLPELLEEDR